MFWFLRKKKATPDEMFERQYKKETWRKLKKRGNKNRKWEFKYFN